jgi:hypothetical protein
MYLGIGMLCLALAFAISCGGQSPVEAQIVGPRGVLFFDGQHALDSDGAMWVIRQTTDGLHTIEWERRELRGVPVELPVPLSAVKAYTVGKILDTSNRVWSVTHNYNEGGNEFWWISSPWPGEL